MTHQSQATNPNVPEEHKSTDVKTVVNASPQTNSAVTTDETKVCAATATQQPNKMELSIDSADTADGQNADLSGNPTDAFDKDTERDGGKTVASVHDPAAAAAMLPTEDQSRQQPQWVPSAADIANLAATLRASIRSARESARPEGQKQFCETVKLARKYHANEEAYQEMCADPFWNYRKKQRPKVNCLEPQYITHLVFIRMFGGNRDLDKQPGADAIAASYLDELKIEDDDLLAEVQRERLIAGKPRTGVEAVRNAATAHKKAREPVFGDVGDGVSEQAKPVRKSKPKTVSLKIDDEFCNARGLTDKPLKLKLMRRIEDKGLILLVLSDRDSDVTIDDDTLLHLIGGTS